MVRVLVGMVMAVLAVGLGVGLGACDGRSGGGGGGGAPAGKGGGGGALKVPYTVVCTTGMVADAVRAVAGERAKVTALMGPGVDPHLFRPTRSDVALLYGADVVVYSGLMLEGKMTETFDGLKAAGKPTFAVTEDLAAGELIAKAFEPGAAEQKGGAGAGAGGGGDHHDPHVWMDPRTWGRTVAVIERHLGELDPAGKESYARNAAAYRKELEELDAYAERVLTGVPERSRVLVTAHDAFGYFGRRYGVRVEGVQGISTESEAGVRDIQRLVDLIVERGVKAVFVETSVPERNVRAIIAGAASRGAEVKVGGSLYSDAAGAEGTYEGTYVGMIDHNVTTIARALGGDAPEGGMRGKLTR